MAARGVRAKKTEKLDEITIARVQEALTGSSPITKKEACEMLNISYNTTRLNKILAEHDETMQYRAVRKSQLKGTKATNSEIKQVIEWYLNEHPISEIAKAMYRSSTFVKNIISRAGVPEKRPATEKGSGAKIGYLPDECVAESFEIGEKVWYARQDLPAIIKKVMPNTKQTNYIEKYGAECYHIYVIQETEFESSYFGFLEHAGYNAHAIAYDLGSLKHLQKYGAEV